MCPPGTYKGQAGCYLCTICKPDQFILQDCIENRISGFGQDTICIDKTFGQLSSDVEVHTGNYYYLEVMCIVVLAAIIFGLILWNLILCKTRRTVLKGYSKAKCPAPNGVIVYKLAPRPIQTTHYKTPPSKSKGIYVKYSHTQKPFIPISAV